MRPHPATVSCRNQESRNLDAGRDRTKAWPVLRTTVSLGDLPDAAHRTRPGLLELNDTVFGPALHSHFAKTETRRANKRDESEAIDPTAALRAAHTVLECDAVLSAHPVDWTALVAAHESEPFAQAQRRALIAQKDCPDRLTAALLTPWDPHVANRLVARQAKPPQWAWWPALQRMGEARPSLWRRVLTEQNLPAVLRSAPRIDLLVLAVNGYDHTHTWQVRAFWDAVGGALRARLGNDPDTWLAVARLFPEHHGSLEDLIGRLDDATTTTGRYPPDLRVLTEAPTETLVDIIAGFTDEALVRAADRSLSGVDKRQSHFPAILERLRRADVPNREVFARWAHGYDSIPVSVWLHGLNERLDADLLRRSHTDVELRRLLAGRRHPQPLISGLVTRLRECPDPIEVQALLDGACRDSETPWSDLVDAHKDTPLTPAVLCVLAARPGFPDILANALPPETLNRLAGQGPASARAALEHAGHSSVAHPHRLSFDLYHRIQSIRGKAVLTDDEVVTTVRPASAVLSFGENLPPGTQPRNSWGTLCASLLEQAVSEAGPGFWCELARQLPDFKGTLPELLSSISARP